MSNPVNLLEHIQRIDLEIEAIRKKGEEWSGALEEGRAELEDIEGEMARLSTEIEELNGLRLELEEKLRVNREKIETDEKRLGEAVKEKQIKALTKEISNARKAVRLHEMELTSVNEKLEKKTEELQGKQALSKDKTEEVERASNELDIKQKDQDGAIEEKQNEKDSVAGSLSPSLLSRYETIRKRRAGLGVVPVKDETCRGCHMNIPPQTYILLMRDTEEIITCPHCHRILYFESSETAPKKPSEQEVV